MQLNLHTHTHIQSHKPQSLTPWPSLVTQAQCSTLYNKWLHISNAGAHSPPYRASRQESMIIARSNVRFSTYYKSSDSFICLFNICDKNPFHPFNVASLGLLFLFDDWFAQSGFAKNDSTKKYFACNYMDAPFHDRRWMEARSLAAFPSGCYRPSGGSGTMGTFTSWHAFAAKVPVVLEGI